MCVCVPCLVVIGPLSAIVVFSPLSRPGRICQLFIDWARIIINYQVGTTHSHSLYTLIHTHTVPSPPFAFVLDALSTPPSGLDAREWLYWLFL